MTAVQVTLRPRLAGANIRAWIGFKHLLSLVEEAVVAWFRAGGLGLQRLLLERGVAIRITDLSAMLHALVELDHEVAADVTPTGAGAFAVTLWRSGDVKVLTARVRVEVAAGHAALPAALAAMLLPAATPAPPMTAAPGAFTWTWRARYFHCHSTLAQHGAFIGALEESVDRFLADRGLSIAHVLATRNWIPVVSRVRVWLHAEVRMEEDVVTTFEVRDVMRRRAHDGVMTCVVRRDGDLVPAASATILHGYAIAAGDGAGQVVDLDDDTIARLRAGGAS